MEDKIQQVLKSIGLTENEIKIYLDLLKNGLSSVLDISRRTKIYRSNTYDAIKGLADKGFVIETIEEKKKLFKPISPERIKDYVLQKEYEVDSILPGLKELLNTSEEKENVSITKGLFAMRNTFYDLLELKQPIYAYGISEKAAEFVGLGFLDEFHKKRIKMKIPMKHIYNHESKDRIKNLNKRKYTEAGYLSREYAADAPTNICGDTVIFFVLSNPVSIIKIKSKMIADTYHKFFEVLWNNAKKI